jgi:hypothetical protein
MAQQSPETEQIIASLTSGERQDLVILFIPSHDKKNKPINNQEFWADAAMNEFADLFKGATAFQTFAGIYKEDDGTILRDKPILIESYARREFTLDANRWERMIDFIKRMGSETKQAAVALVVNDVLHLIEDF